MVCFHGLAALFSDLVVYSITWLLMDEPFPQYSVPCIDPFVAQIFLFAILAIAVAIKLTDGGPVFYKQCRLTKNGKPFMVHKFRRMRVDAASDGIARLSTGDKDDWITPAGRFIRKVRLDELSQLSDILKGKRFFTENPVCVFSGQPFP